MALFEVAAIERKPISETSTEMRETIVLSTVTVTAKNELAAVAAAFTQVGAAPANWAYVEVVVRPFK